jgi:hypothetical protein
MAKFDVSITFTGLCGLLPDKPFGDPHNKPTKASILMPATPDPGRFASGRNLDAHAAVLIANADEVWRNGVALGATGRVAIPVSEHSVTLDHDSNSSFDGIWNPNLDPENPAGDPRDLGWKIRMDRVVGTGEVAKECLDPLVRASYVASVVEVSAGTLACRTLAGGGAYAKMRLSLAADPILEKGRYLANEMTLTISKASRFAVVLENFDPAKPQDRFEFQPKGKDLELVIGNLCGDDLVEKLTGVPIPSAGPSDDDFCWMYRLLFPRLPASVLSALPRPEEVSEAGAGSAGKPRCFGAIFEP